MRWGTNENRVERVRLRDQWDGGPMRTVERVTRGDLWEWGHRVQTMRRGHMNWGTRRWEGTNGMGDQWDGGPKRWGTNGMGDVWVPMRWGRAMSRGGGPMRWGTNEMGANWGTNEMGDQRCALEILTRSASHTMRKFRVFWSSRNVIENNLLARHFQQLGTCSDIDNYDHFLDITWKSGKRKCNHFQRNKITWCGDYNYFRYNAQFLFHDNCCTGKSQLMSCLHDLLLVTVLKTKEVSNCWWNNSILFVNAHSHHEPRNFLLVYNWNTPIPRSYLFTPQSSTKCIRLNMNYILLYL